MHVGFMWQREEVNRRTPRGISIFTKCDGKETGEESRSVPSVTGKKRRGISICAKCDGKEKVGRCQLPSLVLVSFCTFGICIFFPPILKIHFVRCSSGPHNYKIIGSSTQSDESSSEAHFCLLCLSPPQSYC
jgi:hypothetical protein